MFTRQDYLNGICTFREYYGQFVTPSIKEIVLKQFSLNELLQSKDEHLNDLKLSRWDALHIYFKGVCKEDNSLSFSVCLAKEAARQLIEENK